jgi:hypothetical protein
MHTPRQGLAVLRVGVYSHRKYFSEISKSFSKFSVKEEVSE